MKIRLQRAASADLRKITNYIERDNPAAARALVQQINRRLALIAETGFTAMGSPGRVAGTRIIVVGSYVVVYRCDERRPEIVVVSIIHGARRR